MPGLNDLHVHPAYGMTVELYECVFPPTFTPDDLAKKITECVERNPDVLWISGGQWETDFFIKYDIYSPREWLDQYSGDKAILLRDSSFHNFWANSKALELAGIDINSPPVDGGKIVRDSVTNEPNGLLYERASDLVRVVIPGLTDEQFLRAARAGIDAAAPFGITGLKEAWASVLALESYKKIAEDTGLNAHLAVAISVEPFLSEDKVLDMEAFNKARNDNRAKNLNPDFAKIVLDGVPSASRTAAMLNDYQPHNEQGDTTKGFLIYPPEKLNKMIADLDKSGVTVKTHAAGDWSARATLDAIAYARQRNGDNDLLHEVSHAGFIDPTDIPRFKELGAIAEVSPYIWFPSVKTSSIIRAVGERGNQYWPVKDLLDAGIDVVAGSDWPAGALPNMTPWVGMEALITRQNPWGLFPGHLWEKQALTVEEAIDIYTLHGAQGLKLADQTGSLEVGKSADIIVLNHNLFEIPPADISETEVQMTIFEGRIVYEKKDTEE